MPEIDPVYFVTPVAVMAITFGSVTYWHVKKRFTLGALLYSFIAYFGAIILKEVAQSLTLNRLVSAVHGDPYLVGAYYASQTVVFEVGGAYIVARYASTRGRLFLVDAPAYGLGLAMWENGVLVGIPLLIQYAAYYVLLTTGQAATLYPLLQKEAPSLFLPPSQALPLVGYAVLERASSIMAHFAWGLLAVVAAVTGRRIYLLVSLPMGLVDFLVPFAGRMGLPAFEACVFCVGLLCLLAATLLGRRAQSVVAQTQAERGGLIGLWSLSKLNFRRAIGVGKIYLVLSVVFLLLYAFVFSHLPTSPQTSKISPLTDVYPLLAPLFVVIGSMGVLWVFVIDKDRGVYEYLLAYGLDVLELFWSNMVAAALAATIPTAVSVGALFVALALTHVPVGLGLVELLVFYTVPLSYASPLFMTMAGMVWSALTARRAGVNTPIGVAPLLGILPVLLTFFLSLVFRRQLLYVAATISFLVVASCVVLCVLADSLMARERLLPTG